VAPPKFPLYHSPAKKSIGNLHKKYTKTDPKFVLTSTKFLI
jgi:hypothetical protein